MEGSIADSTVLRMRTQLQRNYHSTPTSGADGFLEELLKMPAAPMTDRGQVDASDPPAEPSTTPTAAPTAHKQSESGDQPKDEKESTDQPAAAPSLLMNCAPTCLPPAEAEAPATEPEALTQQPVVDTAQSVTNSVAEAAPEVITAESPSVEIDSSAVTETVEAEAPSTEVVQPVQPNSPSIASDALNKHHRDSKRSQDRGAKADAPAQRPQSADATVEAKPTAPVEPSAKTDKPATAELDKPTATDQPVTAAGAPATETQRDKDDDSRPRDKWYENAANGSDNQSTSLVESLQAELKDPSPANDALNPDVTTANSFSDAQANNPNTIVAVPDAAAQLAADSLQLASDAAVAAQAMLAQSQQSSTVTGSSGSAGVDAAGRVRDSLPGNGSSASGSAGGAAVTSTGASRAGSGRTASANASESPDQPREITQQERVRLVQRVARSFSRLGPDGGQVTLKLNPPQLGVLNVSIKIEGQTMTARLQTETTAARDVIIDNLPVLRDRLSEHGIEVEKFQVEVGQQEDLASGSGQSGNAFGNNGDSQQNSSTAPAEVDYRRLARGNASRQTILIPPSMEPKLQGWPTTDRSLDVKA